MVTLLGCIGAGADVVTIVGGVGWFFSGRSVANEAGLRGVDGLEEFNTSEALTWRLACGVLSLFSKVIDELGAGADMRVSLYTDTGLSATAAEGTAVGICFGGALAVVGGFVNTEVGG